MINKTWTTLLNVSGSDLRYRRVPGGFLVDPDYRPATGIINRRFDEALFGTVGEPYYRVWKARACMRLLYECELISQIEDASYHYDLEDTTMFWDVWGTRVTPSARYKTILEVYGTPKVDMDSGIIHRGWSIRRDNNQLTISDNDDTQNAQIVDIVWIGQSSQMIALPKSDIQIRVYCPDLLNDTSRPGIIDLMASPMWLVHHTDTLASTQSTPIINDWLLDSLGKPTFDLAGLYTDIEGCGVNVGTVLSQTIKNIGLQTAWERHPLIWVRAAVGLAAICQMRINNA